MGLKPGMTNNPNGRPKKALNKIAGSLRTNITEFLEMNFDEVVKEWKKSTGRDKLQFYRDLLQFSVPRLASTEIKTDYSRMTDEELNNKIAELLSEPIANE